MRGCQFGVFQGQIIGGAQGVDRGANDRVVDGLCNTFAHQVDRDIAVTQALYIIVAIDDR